MQRLQLHESTHSNEPAKFQRESSILSDAHRSTGLAESSRDWNNSLNKTCADFASIVGGGSETF